MQYTEFEIVKEYNNAKYRNKKIGVLAQLNCVSRKEIIEILERNGVKIPQKYKDSNMEEYRYKVFMGIDPDEKPKKADKQPLKKPVKDEVMAEIRSEETEKPENITKEVDSEPEKVTEVVKAEKKPRKEEDMIGEATYHLVQISLARIESRLTKIERKQKKLKRLYKQLANLILG